MTYPCAELVARCFAARTSAHFAHLCTKSFAQHSALGDFYDAIASAADEYIECYMGVYGQLEVDDFPYIRPGAGPIITQLTTLRTWIAENREDCCEAGDDKDGEQAESNDVDCTELANLIDNILSTIDRTLYKLKFLK
jgi:hypothetical protein